jgi:hypothetical protein
MKNYWSFSLNPCQLIYDHKEDIRRAQGYILLVILSERQMEGGAFNTLLDMVAQHEFLGMRVEENLVG